MSAPALNIGSKTDDWRAQNCSNFDHTPFRLWDILFESAEGFWMGLKFPEGSPEQLQAFKLWGYTAKKFGYKAKPGQPLVGTFTWKGQTYIVGGPQHQGLMRKALIAKFTQNETARNALLATKGMVLTHIMPRDSVTIPGKVFAGFLVEIRDSGILAARQNVKGEQCHV